MKRILHVVGIMDVGGQETFIMNVYRKIDRTKYQFDFIVQSEKEGFYDDEIRKLGGNIYVIKRFKENPIKHIIQLKKIIKKNKYDVLHRHTNSSIVFIDLLVAKLCHVKEIIVHSHSTAPNTKTWIHKLFIPLINRFSTKRLACSNMAGKFLYGNKDFKIITNGIDIKKFIYDREVRNRIRQEYQIKSNDIVVGHVGRFSEEKNHEFIINFFEKVKKNNIHLFLIGDGPEKEKITKMVNEKKLNTNVKFIGNTPNVSEYLQAMDLFLFPSKYEGLGISLIEAQASGLKCIVNDVIPEEAILTDKVKKYSINEMDKWIKEFNNTDFENEKRTIYTKNDKVFSYYIENTVQTLCSIYNSEE